MGNENDLAYFKYSELDSVSSLGTADKLVVFESNVPKQGSTIANVLALAAVTDIEDSNGDLTITRDLDVTRNETVGGTLGVTGVTTLTGALNANGGIACDTDKFTVADTTGNTVIAGTLDVTGDVTASANIVSSHTDYSAGAGALPVTTDIIFLTTGGAEALTLADGVAGQELRIVMVVDGGDGTLTPSNFGNGTTITFDDAGDSVHLVFDGTNWWSVGTATATIA